MLWWAKLHILDVPAFRLRLANTLLYRYHLIWQGLDLLSRKRARCRFFSPRLNLVHQSCSAGFYARKRLFMAGIFRVRHCIPKLSAIRLEVSLQIAAEAPWSMLHYESSHILFVVLVSCTNVIEKVAYRFIVLLVSRTGGNMMVHRALIRRWPPLIHVVTRFVPTGIRASVCSVVVAIIAVTVLRPQFYEQVLTRLHG